MKLLNHAKQLVTCEFHTSHLSPRLRTVTAEILVSSLLYLQLYTHHSCVYTRSFKVDKVDSDGHGTGTPAEQSLPTCFSSGTSAELCSWGSMAVLYLGSATGCD